MKLILRRLIVFDHLSDLLADDPVNVLFFNGIDLELVPELVDQEDCELLHFVLLDNLPLLVLGHL